MKRAVKILVAAILFIAGFILPSLALSGITGFMISGAAVGAAIGALFYSDASKAGEE
ncbi:MAG TPA: hypothetical protein PKI14_04410 [Fervidobacterium sp.]|nr:hypothetical protein [Fervidobacterium sp.]